MTNDTSESAEAGPIEPEPGLVGFPWPPQPGVSALDALARTWVWSVARPAMFFRLMPPDGSLGAAAFFHAVCAFAGAGADLFWRMVLARAAIAWADGPATDPLVDFLFAVPLSLLAACLAAFLLHAALFTLGAASRPYGATLRAVLYAGGPAILLAIPVLGSFAAAIVWLVITTIALREVHATTTGRAIAAMALILFGLTMLIALLITVALVSGLALGWSWRA